MPHVTFVHGIGNKIEAKALERSWVDALRSAGGPDLVDEGVSTSMCYWADVLYEEPLPETPATVEAGQDADLQGAQVIDEPWFQELPADQQREVLELAAEVGAVSWLTEPDDDTVEASPDDLDADGAPEHIDFERVWLPASTKKRLMESFLRDVHHYLWNVQFSPRAGVSYPVRSEIRQRMLDTLAAAPDDGGPHVVVGHSLGSVIAYDVLKNVADVPAVQGLITIGSPLGLDEVQDGLAPEWTRWEGFPSRRVRGRWVNVYDRLDPVCGFDPHLANDFRRGGREVVTDIHEASWGKWRHSIGKYLRRPQLREVFVELLDLG